MPERIVAARWKMALLLLIALAFVGGAFLIPMAEWSFKVWFCFCIFGPATLIFGLGMIKPATLDLDAQGFTYAFGVMQARRIAWGDVDRFFVWKPPRGGRMVGYAYSEDRRPASFTAKLNRMLGVDGSLPNLFPIKPEALAEKLETYRQRFGGARPAAWGE